MHLKLIEDFKELEVIRERLNDALYTVNSDLIDYSESIVKTVMDYINNKTFKYVTNSFNDINPFLEIDDEEMPF